MILNRLEFALVTNPLREAVQRRFEATRLLRLGGALPGGTALEVGCGAGFGTRLILEMFGADRVDAFDLDHRMVALAHSRLRDVSHRVRLWVGDVTAIAAPDDSYDAVFDFAIVHHVPDWRKALREMHRVLKPGGRVYVEDMLAGLIDRPLARRFFDHPRLDRFDGRQLGRAVREVGFEVISERELWGSVAWLAGTKRRGAARTAPPSG